MKKAAIKTILICALLVLLISNICYADVVYMPTATENAISVISGEGDFFELLLVFVPLIIIYVILVEVLLLRSRKKTKAKKIIIILITLILLAINVIVIKNTIESNTIETVKYAYLDQNNNVVIEPSEYAYIEEFSNGVAKVGSEYSRGFHHAVWRETNYGYINKNGDIIIPTEYDDLSYFNKDGYAYGIINYVYSMFPYNINNLSEDEINEMDLHFYKFDMDGNKEEISYKDYVEGRKDTPETIEFDQDIRLVEQVNREYMDDIYGIIVPIICIIISIIVLIKVLKKDKKEDVVEK